MCSFLLFASQMGVRSWGNQRDWIVRKNVACADGMERNSKLMRRKERSEGDESAVGFCLC